MEFVEVFALLVYLDPGVEFQVCEYLILGLETKLITKFTAWCRAKDVMLTRLALRRLERALHIVEDAVTIQAWALEISMIIVCDANDLFSSSHLFDHFIVSTVKYLNVTLIKRHKNESLIS